MKYWNFFVHLFNLLQKNETAKADPNIWMLRWKILDWAKIFSSSVHSTRVRLEDSETSLFRSRMKFNSNSLYAMQSFLMRLNEYFRKQFEWTGYSGSLRIPGHRLSVQSTRCLLVSPSIRYSLICLLANQCESAWRSLFLLILLLANLLCSKYSSRYVKQSETSVGNFCLVIRCF